MPVAVLPYLAITFMHDTCGSPLGRVSLAKNVSSLKEKGSGIFIQFHLHVPPAPWHNHDDNKEPIPGSKLLSLQYPWAFKVSVLPRQGEQKVTQKPTTS